MLENLDPLKPNYRVIRSYTGGKSGNPVFRVLPSPSTTRFDYQILKASQKASDLKSEVEMTQKLSKLFESQKHNPIIQIFDQGQIQYKDAKYHYYVMEDLKTEYELLSKLFRKQCKTIDHTLMKKVFLNLFNVIRRMKEELWSHCDLHPENIFVNKMGQIKLIDFGLAKQNKCTKQRNVTEVLAKLMWACKHSLGGYVALIGQMAKNQKVDSDISMYITMLSMLYETVDNFHLFIELKYLSNKIFEANQKKTIKALLKRFHIVLNLILNQ